jgi:hypothetical protein
MKTKLPTFNQFINESLVNEKLYDEPVEVNGKVLVIRFSDDIQNDIKRGYSTWNLGGDHSEIPGVFNSLKSAVLGLFSDSQYAALFNYDGVVWRIQYDFINDYIDSDNLKGFYNYLKKHKDRYLLDMFNKVKDYEEFEEELNNDLEDIKNYYGKTSEGWIEFLSRFDLRPDRMLEEMFENNWESAKYYVLNIIKEMDKTGGKTCIEDIRYNKNYNSWGIVHHEGLSCFLAPFDNIEKNFEMAKDIANDLLGSSFGYVAIGDVEVYKSMKIKMHNDTVNMHFLLCDSVEEEECGEPVHYTD